MRLTFSMSAPPAGEASAAAAGFEGAAISSSGVARGAAGAGSQAFSLGRSTLPLALEGKASSMTNSAGSMYSGSSVRICALSLFSASASLSAGTAKARRNALPSGLCTGTVTHWVTTPLSVAAPFISSSSIRRPFSFIWASRRPRQSMSPSAFSRAMSPVRYMRSPGNMGSSAKAAWVRSGLPT